ncbi:hypothetical protein EJB05_02837, partial [Eragrostis curvula]
MESVFPGPEARAPPDLTDHLLEEVLVRIGARSDLIRASAACKTFRRLITDPSFLRRYRTLHPPLVLGFVGLVGPVGSTVRFLPAEAPHSNAPFADSAHFSFDYRPACGLYGWPRYDARDGRVLLMSRSHLGHGRFVSPELAVCNLFTGGYMVLAPIPDDLRTSVLVQVLQEEYSFSDAFFDPSLGNEVALFREEAQFRVMCWAKSDLMAAVFIYCSVSGSWSHGTSIFFSTLGLDVQPDGYPVMCGWHSYAYGCLYWDTIITNKMIKLDINSMKSTIVTLPRDHEDDHTIFVEAGEGRIGMFRVSSYDSKNSQPLKYSIRQNENGNADERSVETTIPLPAEYDSYHFDVAAQGYIFLVGEREDLLAGSAFFSVEIETLKVERVCEANFGPKGYVRRFRPFMSPRRI